MRIISLIDGDIKRLKSHKFNSLLADLDTLYKEHEEHYSIHGSLPGKIASEAQYSIHKVRMAITQPFRPPKKGVRLWIYFDHTKHVYVQCLLYLAEDEDRPAFKKTQCYKTIKERLQKIEESL